LEYKLNYSEDTQHNLIKELKKFTFHNTVHIKLFTLQDDKEQREIEREKSMSVCKVT